MHVEIGFKLLLYRRPDFCVPIESFKLNEHVFSCFSQVKEKGALLRNSQLISTSQDFWYTCSTDRKKFKVDHCRRQTVHPRGSEVSILLQVKF